MESQIQKFKMNLKIVRHCPSSFHKNRDPFLYFSPFFFPQVKIVSIGRATPPIGRNASLALQSTAHVSSFECCAIVFLARQHVTDSLKICVSRISITHTKVMMAMPG